MAKKTEKPAPGEDTTPRGRWLTFVIFGALVLAGILLLWFYWERGVEEPSAPAPTPTEDVRYVPSGVAPPLPPGRA